MLECDRKYLAPSTVTTRVMAILLATALALAPLRLSAAGFFQSIDDLPLAPGLTEIVDDGVEFDSPAGRIVTAVAGGNARPGAVRAFYLKALPSLGWVAVPGGSYRRDGEVLTLRIETAGNAVKLKIRVVPAPPGADR